MNNRKGFTLVEILAVIAILAVLATAAGIGVTSSISKQRQKLAYQAEENIAEAAVSYYSNKGNLYLKPCTNADGSYVTITEKKVNELNDKLRKSEGIKADTEELVYQNMKTFSNLANGGGDEKSVLNSYIGVADSACYKTVTVGELMEQGFITDSDHMCNKASMIVVYRKTDSKNTAGIITSVQEGGDHNICNSKRTSESGPTITVTPYSQLALSDTKTIKVTVHSDSTELKNNVGLLYSFSTSNRKAPTSYQTVSLTRVNKNEISGTITINDKFDQVEYLWIKAGVVLDNKNNKTSQIVTGPYAFLPTLFVTYDMNNPKAEGCEGKKTVVFKRRYGTDTTNMDAFLCAPHMKGYDFKGWLYKDTDIPIGNYTIVEDKTDHYIRATFEPRVYTIPLDKNGATNNPPSSVKVKFDSNEFQDGTGPVPIPVREHTVKGFSLSKERHSLGANVSGNATLTSKYEFLGWYSKVGGVKVISESNPPKLEKNVLYFTDADGNWIKDERDVSLIAQWKTNSVLTYEIEKAGYDCGWTTSENGNRITIPSNSEFTPKEDTEIFGVCEACDYNVIYDKNNALATGTMSNTTCTYDDNCILRNNGYSLTNNTFNGWNTKSDKTGTSYANKASVKNLTDVCDGNVKLYANWCNNCSKVSHGSCVLDTDIPGTCTYKTSCDNGYTIGGNGTSSPTCTANVYSIAYSLDGGTNHSSNPSTYTIESNDITIQNPTKSSYTFMGWTGSNGTTVAKKPKIKKGSTGNKNYTAHWCHDCATNGAECKGPKLNSAGACTYETSCPSGYTISNNGKYNASCSPNEYSITYNLNGGTNHSSNPSTYTETDANITIQNPTKEGSVFMGWTGSNGTTPGKNPVIRKGSTGNKEYTAHWCSECVPSGGAKCTGPTLNSSGVCTYITTCEEGHKISANGTSHPSCDVEVYKINYVYNGGTAPSSGVPDTYAYGSGAIINGVPTNATYTFNGWSASSNLSNPRYVQTISKTDTGDKTFYAKWCQKCASVSHGKCKLDVSKAGTCTYETSCNEGYHLTSGQNTRSPVCSPNKFTVAYNGNGSDSGSTSSHECIYDVSCKLAANGFRKNNAKFKGWTFGSIFKKPGDGITSFTTVDGKKVEFSAQWECNNGYHFEGNTCVNDCPSGYHNEGGTCVENCPFENVPMCKKAFACRDGFTSIYGLDAPRLVNLHSSGYISHHSDFLDDTAYFYIVDTTTVNGIAAYKIKLDPKNSYKWLYYDRDEGKNLYSYRIWNDLTVTSDFNIRQSCVYKVGEKPINSYCDYSSCPG